MVDATSEATLALNQGRGQDATRGSGAMATRRRGRDRAARLDPETRDASATTPSQSPGQGRWDVRTGLAPESVADRSLKTELRMDIPNME